jgi:hypothetical protein
LLPKFCLMPITTAATTALRLVVMVPPTQDIIFSLVSCHTVIGLCLPRLITSLSVGHPVSVLSLCVFQLAVGEFSRTDLFGFSYSNNINYQQTYALLNWKKPLRKLPTLPYDQVKNLPCADTLAHLFFLLLQSFLPC